MTDRAWWFGEATTLRAVAARVLRHAVDTFEDAQGRERITEPSGFITVEHRDRAGFRQVVGAYKGRYTDAPEPMSSHGYGNVGWYDDWPGEPVPLQGKEYDRFELEPSIYEVACPAQHGARIYRAWRDDLSIFDDSEGT